MDLNIYPSAHKWYLCTASVCVCPLLQLHTTTQTVISTVDTPPPPSNQNSWHENQVNEVKCESLSWVHLACLRTMEASEVTNTVEPPIKDTIEKTLCNRLLSNRHDMQLHSLVPRPSLLPCTLYAVRSLRTRDCKSGEFPHAQRSRHVKCTR